MLKIPTVSAQVHVGRVHLRRAFNRHRTLPPDLPASSRMLLQLYAIECGLKLLLLQFRQQQSTADLDDDDRIHDLDRLLDRVGQRKIRIGSYNAQEPKNAGRLASGRLHELFRYGGAIAQSDQTKLGKCCADVLDWIEQQVS